MTRYERFLEISDKVEEFIMDSLLGLIIGAITVIAILSGIVFGIAWIFSDKTDRGQCLESHRETYVVYTYINNVMVPNTGYRNVCDMWEYPSGRG